MDDTDVTDRGPLATASPAVAPGPRSALFRRQDSGDQAGRPRRGWRWVSWPGFGVAAALAVLASLLLKSFVVAPVHVADQSMAETLRPGERVLVDLRAYRGRPPARGDIVLADVSGLLARARPVPPPSSGLAQLMAPLARLLGTERRTYLAPLRVVGLPGDRIACCDAQGRLSRDGTPVQEPYLAYPPTLSRGLSRFETTVAPGTLWLMADNRALPPATGSPYPVPGLGGPVRLDQVQGRVAAVYWPPGSVRGIPGASGGQPARSG